MRANKKVITEICEQFKLNKSYLDKKDLEQEALIALFVAKSFSHREPEIYVKKHLLQIVKESSATSFHCSVAEKEDPIEYIIAVESKAKLMKILRILIERCPAEQKIVLKLIYGLLDGKCHNYDEIALMFKLPVDKIKEIEKQAICTIRSSKGLDTIYKNLVK